MAETMSPGSTMRSKYAFSYVLNEIADFVQSKIVQLIGNACTELHYNSTQSRTKHDVKTHAAVRNIVAR